MSLPSGYFRRCPKCGSHSLRKLRRRWWQRWLNLPHRYHCHDCGSRLAERETRQRNTGN